MRRFADAASNAQLAIQDEPEYTAAYRLLGASYAQMGRLHEAREVIMRLRAIAPRAVQPTNLTVFRNPEQRELLLSGLLLAIGET
jgi:Flp pilus assembly protein TadD